MKHEIRILAALTLALCAAASFAEPDPSARGRPGGIGIEVSPIMPFAKIYPIQGTIPLWEMGDLIFGYAYQNQVVGAEGRASAHTLLVGYRQYIWKGLFAEVEFFPAVNDFTSSVDGGHYGGFELVYEIRPGYRWDIPLRGGASLYLLAEISVLLGLYEQHPWPNMSAKPFVFPLAWIGLCL